MATPNRRGGFGSTAAVVGLVALLVAGCAAPAGTTYAEDSC